eukprot:s6235_g1.t1
MNLADWSMVVFWNESAGSGSKKGPDVGLDFTDQPAPSPHVPQQPPVTPGDDMDYPGYDDPHVDMPVDDEDMPPPNSAPEPDLNDDPIELGSGGNPPPHPPGSGTHVPVPGGGGDEDLDMPHDPDTDGGHPPGGGPQGPGPGYGPSPDEPALPMEYHEESPPPGGPPDAPGAPPQYANPDQGDFPIQQTPLPAPTAEPPVPADGEDTDSDATVDYRGDPLLALVAGDDDVLIRLPSSFAVPSFVPLDGDGFASWLTKQDKIKAGTITQEMQRKYAKEVRAVQEISVCQHGWSDCAFSQSMVAAAVYQFALAGVPTEGLGGLEPQDILKSLRALRILRAFRLLRLLKMSRLSVVIEEASVAAGRQWLVLVVAIVNTTLTMVLCAHVLACGWYLLGRDSFDQRSWLELGNITELDGPIQYVHALQWVLMPPSPPPVSNDNVAERLYCIFIMGSTVVIIGSALSKITGTLAELRTINSEGSKRRREVRQYLHAQHVSMELTSRIMRFVDYKLGRQSSVALDASLLSPSLVIELQVSQRGAQLAPHPLFGIIREAFPEVFAAICGAVEKHVFGKMETVFAADSWANYMWITTTGRFLHAEVTDEIRDAGSVASPSLSADGTCLDWNVILAGEWFAEAALFAEAVTHDSTLRAETFGEAFSLKGAALVRTLMNSPACTAMVCEYGKDLLAKLSQSKSTSGETNCTYKVAEAISHQCLKQNSFYQAFHPDPRTALDDFDLFQEHPASEYQKEDSTREESVFGNVKNEVARRIRRTGKAAAAEPAAVVVEEAATENQNDRNCIKRSSSILNGKILSELAGQLVSKQVSMEEAVSSLRACIPELSPQNGTYAQFEQACKCFTF